MDIPKPDDIQAQPPERRPEEIQAHAPPPHAEPPPSPDYDFRKRSSWTWVLVLVLGGFLGLCLWSALSFKTDKSFSNVGSAIQSTGS